MSDAPQSQGPVSSWCPLKLLPPMSDLRKQRGSSFLKEHRSQPNTNLGFCARGRAAPVIGGTHAARPPFSARCITSYLHLTPTGALHRELFFSLQHVQRTFMFLYYPPQLICCQLLTSNCGKTILPHGCCYQKLSTGPKQFMLKKRA